MIPGVGTSAKHASLGQRTDAFCSEYVAPIASEIDRTNQLPIDVVRAMGKAGLMGIPLPVEYGGYGGSGTDLLVVVERIARISGAVANILGVHTLCSYGTILGFGTDVQKQKYLPSMATGSILGAFAVTEPGAGSDAAAVQTRATREGSRWRIYGRKTQITGGTHADLVAVLATVDPLLKHKGIALFLVESSTPGFRVARVLDTVGHRGSGLAEIELDGVLVDPDAMVGSPGDGLRIVKHVIEFDKLIAATSAMAIAEAALDLSLAHVEARVQFDGPLSQQQAVQFALAEAAINIHATRSLIREAAHIWDLREDVSLAARAAKVLGAERALAVCLSALHLHAGVGYTRDLPLDRYIRDVQGFGIAGGTTEVQKLLVARSLLRSSRGKVQR